MPVCVRLFICAAAALWALCAAAQGSAAPAPLKARQSAAAPHFAAMKTSGITSQPIGHYDFCRRYRQKCAARKSAAPLRLTQSLWRRINRVNARINTAIIAATDREIYGKEEYWEYPDKAGGRGDCEDYALMKQRALEKIGIPAADLLITVVRKPDGEAHAVLTLRTASGDYILDNLRDFILSWQHTEYRYIKRQAVSNAGLWVAIEPRQSGAPLVASAQSAGLSGGLAATRAIR